MPHFITVNAQLRCAEFLIVQGNPFRYRVNNENKDLAHFVQMYIHD
jgi:hypothetical protein